MSKRVDEQDLVKLQEIADLLRGIVGEAATIVDRVRTVLAEAAVENITFPEGMPEELHEPFRMRTKAAVYRAEVMSRFQKFAEGVNEFDVAVGYVEAFNKTEDLKEFFNFRSLQAWEPHTKIGEPDETSKAVDAYNKATKAFDASLPTFTPEVTVQLEDAMLDAVDDDAAVTRVFLQKTMMGQKISPKMKARVQKIMDERREQFGGMPMVDGGDA